MKNIYLLLSTTIDFLKEPVRALTIVNALAGLILGYILSLNGSSYLKVLLFSQFGKGVITSFTGFAVISYHKNKYKWASTIIITTVILILIKDLFSILIFLSGAFYSYCLNNFIFKTEGHWLPLFYSFLTTTLCVFCGLFLGFNIVGHCIVLCNIFFSFLLLNGLFRISKTNNSIILENNSPVIYVRAIILSIYFGMTNINLIVFFKDNNLSQEFLVERTLLFISNLLVVRFLYKDYLNTQKLVLKNILIYISYICLIISFFFPIFSIIGGLILMFDISRMFRFIQTKNIITKGTWIFLIPCLSFFLTFNEKISYMGYCLFWILMYHILKQKCYQYIK